MIEIEEKDTSMQLSMMVSAWGSGLSQLASFSALPEQEVADAALKGAVWCKRKNLHKLRRVRNLEQSFSIGDELYLNYNARVLAQKPLIPELVADEVNYSIWNKPTGMLSQGSKWSDHCTITQTVSHVHGKPTFLVHRLDRAAAGLIVVAHTKNALKKLTELFANRAVTKHYHVQVHGHVMGTTPIRIDSQVQNKNAVTDIVQISFDKPSNKSSLLVRIETGRKHQIRDHLSSIGHPVVGDRLFDPERVHEQDLKLTACLLAFVCPFTKVQKHYELPVEVASE